MRILFICKFNRFRSKVAEAYFKKININKKIKVKSAGIIGGSPIDRFAKKISRKNGIIITGKPQGLTSDLLIWQDIIVNVADDVPSKLFLKNKEYGKKLLNWNIKDAKDNNEKEYQEVITKIVKNCDKLNQTLK